MTVSVFYFPTSNGITWSRFSKWWHQECRFKKNSQPLWADRRWRCRAWRLSCCWHPRRWVLPTSSLLIEPSYRWCQIVTPFEKMPWGYTVNCASASILFMFNIVKYRVYLNLRMEGVLLASYYLFLWLQLLTSFILQHVNLTAKPRKPFGILTVSFRPLTHFPPKAQSLIRYLCYLATHTWSPFCRYYSSRSYWHCPFRWIIGHMEQTRRRTDCSPR